MKTFMFYLTISTLIIIGFSFYVRQKEIALPTPLTQQETTVNIWIQDSFSGSESYFDELAQNYESRYPNIHISLDIIQGTDAQVNNYISEKILNGNTPDILLLSLHNYNDFAVEKKLLSLDSYLAQYDRDYFIPSVYNNSKYENSVYGLAYYINPEIIVYRKEDNLFQNNSITEPLTSMNDFINYIENLESYYQKNSIDKIALSIPSLISDGQYVRTIIGSESVKTLQDESLINALHSLHKMTSQPHYDYAKASSHTFFNHLSTYSIEPLSLLYTQIENNYSIKDQLGILSISDQVPVNSNSHYISIYNNAKQKEACYNFLNLFFNETEIVTRYRFYNIPIICTTKQSLFLNDHRFDNTNIWQYLENSFHFNISSRSDEVNENIDLIYENAINKVNE